MFLIERFFGIACYFVVLLFVFALVYYKKAQVKHALIFYILVLSAFAYFYEPYETADLYRIRLTIEAFSRYKFSTFAKVHLSDNSTPAAYIIYWLIAQTGNARLLPAITVAITYSIIFYILYKTARRYSVSNESIAVILLFVMSTGNYMMVISNIRTMLATSLLCFCFYRESVQNTFKLWHIALYLIAALTHNLALILIIIRCMAFIFSSRVQQKVKLFVIALFAVLSLFFVLNLDWLLNDVYDKAVGYISGESYSYIWEYLIAFISLIVEITALRMYMTSSDTKLKENRMYLLMCVITAIIYITQFSIFHRLITYIAPILAVPILVVCFSLPESQKKHRNAVFCLSLLMLLIACFRGSLSSLKFFVL